jgi:hypothetical protein
MALIGLEFDAGAWLGIQLSSLIQEINCSEYSAIRLDLTDVSSEDCEPRRQNILGIELLLCGCEAIPRVTIVCAPFFVR